MTLAMKTTTTKMVALKWTRIKVGKAISGSKMCEPQIPPTFEYSRGMIYPTLKDWQTILQTDGRESRRAIGKVTIMRRAPLSVVIQHRCQIHVSGELVITKDALK
jgi:hypothetical protein